MEARISFSDRFKKQATEELSLREKGRLRWEKLKEAEESGELQAAKDRYSLGKIVGGMNDATAYSWVSNLVYRGYIKEEELGNGEKAYTLVGEPDFDNVTRTKRRKPSHITTRKRKRNRATNKSIAQREQRIIELAENGMLPRARSRGELTRMMALPTSYHVIYNWVHGRIKQGWLKEEQIGEDSFGTPIYTYTLIGEPTVEVQAVEEAKSETKLETVENEAPVLSSNGAVVEITNGKVGIKVTVVDVEQASELVKRLLKGE